MDADAYNEMTAMQTKVWENRIRRMANRQGLTLTKSRTRDPRALDYAQYWLSEGDSGHWRGNTLLTSEGGVSLDEIEAFLTNDSQ